MAVPTWKNVGIGSSDAAQFANIGANQIGSGVDALNNAFNQYQQGTIDAAANRTKANTDQAIASLMSARSTGDLQNLTTGEGALTKAALDNQFGNEYDPLRVASALTQHNTNLAETERQTGLDALNKSNIESQIAYRNRPTLEQGVDASGNPIYAQISPDGTAVPVSGIAPTPKTPTGSAVFTTFKGQDGRDYTLNNRTGDVKPVVTRPDGTQVTTGTNNAGEEIEINPTTGTNAAFTKKQTEIAQGAANSISSAQGVIDVIDSFDLNTYKSVGGGSSYAPDFVTGSEGGRAEFNQLGGIGFLDQISAFEGKGALSDAEGRAIREAFNGIFGQDGVKTGIPEKDIFQQTQVIKQNLLIAKAKSQEIEDTGNPLAYGRAEAIAKQVREANPIGSYDDFRQQTANAAATGGSSQYREGQTARNAAGDVMVFRNGSWGAQ